MRKRAGRRGVAGEGRLEQRPGACMCVCVGGERGGGGDGEGGCSTVVLFPFALILLS